MKCEKCNKDVINDPRNIVYITRQENPLTPDGKTFDGRTPLCEERAIFLCDSCKKVIARCPPPQWM